MSVGATLAYCAGFLFVGILLVMIMAVLIGVVRQGPQEITRLRCQGLGISAWLKGNMPEEE